MKLTEEEKELILEQRAKQKAAEPIKSGILRHDLFHVESYSGSLEVYVSEDDLDPFMTTEKIEEITALCREQLLRGDKLPKGLKFFCYLNSNAERWMGESGYSGYQFDRCWAAEHLEDIKEIKGDK